MFYNYSLSLNLLLSTMFTLSIAEYVIIIMLTLIGRDLFLA